jgi:hypothetical protein
VHGFYWRKKKPAFIAGFFYCEEPFILNELS